MSVQQIELIPILLRLNDKILLCSQAGFLWIVLWPDVSVRVPKAAFQT